MTGKGHAPLSGIRVLDFSRVIAGPLCTQQLADLGAEVIKIENPETGDEFRGFEADGKPARSAFFMAFNRSKQSVAVDLKTEEGCALMKSLAQKSDVLIENFRPGVMKKFGLDEGHLRAANPALIYVSISAYGANVSMSDRPGFDPVLQAESGMMELTGEADGPPMRTGLSLIDTLTASHAATAICAALLSRQVTGQGDYIDLALMDTAIAALGNMGSTWLTNGRLPTRNGNAHVEATPTDLFNTGTEPIYMAMSSNRLFQKLCEDVLAQPALATDEKYRTPIARLRHREQLKQEIEAVLQTDSAEHWLQKMRHLPAGMVRTLDKALASDEVAERSMVQTVHDDDGTEHRLLGSTFKFTNATLRQPTPPPVHGAHTDEVLTTLLGLSKSEIHDLRARGVIP